MQPHAHRPLFLLAASALALGAGSVACGGDHDDMHDGGHHHDGGMAMNCSDDPRADTYAAGLEKASENGHFTVTLRTADPAPPAKGDNTWTIEIRDAGGTPVEGATLTVTPWMPDHGHGTSIDVQVAAGSDPGTYVLSSIDLRMPGLWEVTIEIDAGGVTDSVVFAFCVEG